MTSPPSLAIRTCHEAIWLKNCIAFRHKDGMGFDVLLDATPVNGTGRAAFDDLSEARR
jgi:hypothetical protein